MNYFILIFAFCQIVINFINTEQIRRLYKKFEDLEKENREPEAASK